MINDDIAKEAGFESFANMIKMVAAVDLTKHGMPEAFEAWKDVDGTKAGLERLEGIMTLHGKIKYGIWAP